MSSIFYWASGQDDNIGDVVLRRRLLESLGSSSRLHVHVGGASAGFTEALGVRDDDVVYTNFLKFVWATTLGAFSSNWSFFFDPGEVNCTRRTATMHALLLPALAVARLRGARNIVRTGVGIGKRHSVWCLPIRWSAALCTDNTWRDEDSRQYMRRGHTGPDLAFGYQSFTDVQEPRTMFVISMRGDAKAPDDQFARAMSRVAKFNNLTPIVVVQVRRDSAAMAQLAKRLGCDLLPWPTKVSHKEQERRLRNIYRRARIVQSDRLHCLILGVSEGAYPMALMEHRDTKIGRSFSAAGYTNVSADVSGLMSESIIEIANAIVGGSLGALNDYNQKSAFDMVSQEMCRLEKRVS